MKLTVAVAPEFQPNNSRIKVAGMVEMHVRRSSMVWA